MNRSFKLHDPLSGRLVVREVGGGGNAVVGVLHFAAEFAPQETAAYLLIIVSGNIVVADAKLDEGLPEEIRGMGVGSALLHPCWPATTVPGTLAVRFLRAFDNGWVVFGPSRMPIVSDSYLDCGHAWLDVKNGRVASLSAQFDANGDSCSQLLTGHAVWPSPLGVLHSLPAIESEWRPVYLRHSLLLASLGAGEISEETLIRTVRNDPQLAHIGSLSIDRDYARYLARLRDLGGLRELGPKSAEENDRARDLAQQVIRETIAVV